MYVILLISLKPLNPNQYNFILGGNDNLLIFPDHQASRCSEAFINKAAIGIPLKVFHGVQTSEDSFSL